MKWGAHFSKGIRSQKSGELGFRLRPKIHRSLIHNLRFSWCFNWTIPEFYMKRNAWEKTLSTFTCLKRRLFPQTSLQAYKNLVDHLQKWLCDHLLAARFVGYQWTNLHEISSPFIWWRSGALSKSWRAAWHHRHGVCVALLWVYGAEWGKAKTLLVWVKWSVSKFDVNLYSLECLKSLEDIACGSIVVANEWLEF